MRRLIALVLVLAVAAPAAAQQVDIKAAPPVAREREREPGVIAPGLSEETRPLDADTYPHSGRVPHEPAFFRGLSTKRATGRVGIAAWTSPSVPVGGQGWWEPDGWFVIGFSATWGPPLPAPSRSAP